MGIQAIETVYKGYRFRSRLEARWAVFFDQFERLEWRYEDQGYELPCGRYLPDFFLPNTNPDRVRSFPGTFVEIKPGTCPAFSMPKVYWAGRMGSNSRRPFDHRFTGDTDKGYFPEFRRVRTFNTVRINYTGPFSYSDNHGMADSLHASPTEAMGFNAHDFHLARDQIFRNSVRGIKDCDIFFAILDDTEAHGTLVEIGMAKMLGKRIVLGETEVPMRDYPTFFESALPELWFASEAAWTTFGDEGEGADKIIEKFADWLRSEYPEPKEHEKMRVLCEQTGAGGAVLYGDPVDASEPGTGAFYGPCGLITSLVKGDPTPAHFAARQARFEHGQSGAPYAMA